MSDQVFDDLFNFEVNSPEAQPIEPTPQYCFPDVFTAKNVVMSQKMKGYIYVDAKILNSVRIDCRRKPMNFPVFFYPQ